MNKITKIILVLLSAGSLSLSAIAGELTVTGGVTATMVQGNDNGLGGKGLGVSNEIDFTANGELDNGYTWKWQAQMDGATNLNDDTRLELTTPMGAVAMYISEGDLSSKLGYGIGAMGPGSDYHSTHSAATGALIWGTNMGSYNNIQVHTPAGLLPFDGSVKVGYAPNLADGQGASAKAGGGVETLTVGDDFTQVKVTATPMEGLNVGADYATASSPVSTTRYKHESAGAFVKYTIGAVAVGVAKSGYQPISGQADTSANAYEADMYGVQFAINDQLSISVSQEKFKSSASNAMASTGVRTITEDVNMKSDHIQAAYVVGGATLGVARVQTDNDDFVKNRDATKTTFTVGLAF
jgi:hypothetical protein